MNNEENSIVNNEIEISNEKDIPAENQTSIVEEIKQEDKKSIGKYILIMICCGFVGGLAGLATAYIKMNDLSGNLADGLHIFLIVAAPYIILAIAFISILSVVILYRKSRRLFAAWDGEDENVMSEIETRTSAAMLINAIDTILFLVFMAVEFAGVNLEEGILNGGVVRGIAMVAGYLLTMFSMIITQQKLVNFTKEMNPEKKGSVYDAKFQKKWEDSCDEAEKLCIYKSAYAAYKSVNIACIVLWVICMIGIFVWNFDLVSVFMVGIIWLVSTVSYCMKAIGLIKHPSDK